MDKHQSIHLDHAEKKMEIILFWFILAVLCLGAILTVISAMNLCSQSCAAGHKYRLYGFAFEPLGMAFFLSMATSHFLSRYYSTLRIFVIASLAIALGAEGMFIYAQKYIIGHWCPVCLGIASVVAIAFISASIRSIKELAIARSKDKNGGFMKQIFYSSSVIMLMTLGFFFAQMGFSKFSQLQATEEALKGEMAFGNLHSPIEVYVFTDWKCPACRKIEPVIVESSPEIMKHAKLLFVDVIIHDVSLNFVPFNLSFMVHNKPQYLKLRDDLTRLSIMTDNPTQEQIQELAAKAGVQFTPMPFSELSMANNYFSHLTQQFAIESTPTVAIVNATTKKGKKLNGKEITLQNIKKGIDSLK